MTGDCFSISGSAQTEVIGGTADELSWILKTLSHYLKSASVSCLPFHLSYKGLWASLSYPWLIFNWRHTVGSRLVFSALGRVCSCLFQAAQSPTSSSDRRIIICMLKVELWITVRIKVDSSTKSLVCVKDRNVDDIALIDFVRGHFPHSFKFLSHDAFLQCLPRRKVPG